MSKSWEQGSTWKWRKTRLIVLRRDGYRCRMQIPGVCTITATEVHHVFGRSVTGDDPNYLAASCRPCNQTIGDPTDKPDPVAPNYTNW